MKPAALRCIQFYQAAISPGLGVRCRYEPTCSVFAYEAIDRFGVARGGWMAVRRLLRCRPGREGGYDPVPEVVPEAVREAVREADDRKTSPERSR